MSALGIASLRAAGVDPAFVEIRLAGALVQHVVRLDEDLGWIDIHACDAEGYALVVGGGYLVRRAHGNVTTKVLRRPNGKWPHPGLPEPAPDTSPMSLSAAMGSMFGG